MTTYKKDLRPGGLRALGHEIIFEADTPAGKAFDVILIISIMLSVLVVMADSVHSIQVQYGKALYVLEWGFTVLFTVEYVLRLICVGKPLRYAGSFFGIVDLLAILPTYLSVLIPGSHYLTVIRVLRLLRVFRVLKLAQYVGEANVLMGALASSRRKITVFLFAVAAMVVILGSAMYVIEGEKNGFVSIPASIYWAVVTLTTVGYGDISPKTAPGQALAALVMILGYAIIAVPTGIVSAELVKGPGQKKISTQACPQCSKEGHDPDAEYCKYCGAPL
ncbi:voltage-gated potassium channel [Desulfatibacillum alkenivorans DSM 16219]|jgi:voltage-gated potassium channel|uniref:Voltage-gated potassium channel n=1 Tax=Desulfatibacillum alkenivorans DSM 16219 TaxID=1121393 RepID=A0A1M6QAG0_9BACT|nr:ion transporter [Desulfatibacillum alkenivorans]SHK17171.1 voltage-gated potassium channel [Desulfatibacillum alkenivorans DSM 16219]